MSGRGKREERRAENRKPTRQTHNTMKTTEAENGKTELRDVPIESIEPDPNQPRKVFASERLEEMRQSILAHGIIEPLIVCPYGGSHYWLVAGERRWRGAKLAGLKTVPVLVRHDLADANKASAVQLIENVQRENLTALEEAEAYKQRVAAGTRPEELAKELGVSRATVFGRLALTRLPPLVRDALLAGRITPTVGGLIAMVPTVKEQEKLLKEVQHHVENDGTDYVYERAAKSFREVQELIEEEYCVPLKDAKFKLDDGELLPLEWEVSEAGSEPANGVRVKGTPVVPEKREATAVCEMVSGGAWYPWHVIQGIVDPKTAAKRELLEGWKTGGRELLGPNDGKVAKAFAKLVNEGKPLVMERAMGGACNDCPYRSGNLAQFPDAAKRPNICTRPACFHQKQKAYWTQRAEVVKAQGKTVLDATAYKRSKGEYVEAEKELYTENKGYKSFKELLGKQTPEPVLAVTEKGLVMLYPKEEAMARARKKGVRFHEQHKPETAEEKAKRAEKEAQEKQRAAARQNLVAEVFGDVLKGLAKLSEKGRWERMDGYLSEHHRMQAILKGAGKEPWERALAKTVGYPMDWQGRWDETAAKDWKELGVDLKALEKDREAQAAANEKKETTTTKPTKPKAKAKAKGTKR